MHNTRALALCAAGLVGLTGCVEEDPANEIAAEVPEIVLGPVDGHDMPATDLDRVSAGDLAPDFTAMSRDGDAITLSQHRGKKNVVLVFYRGHW